ncbi:adenosine deaminase family protein [bacterium]|nr:adenosine deaminase family protein [bacterium]
MEIGNKSKFLEVIKKVPKNDLHVHLDGSVRLETIIDISKKEKLNLPSFTVEGLGKLVFKDQYESLADYLTTFSYSGAVMQKPEYLERIAYELALDNQEEGVRYLEVRFAPQLHINKLMGMDSVLTAVNKGLEKAQKEFNNRLEIVSGEEPPFFYGIIVCAMRNFGPWSLYYKNLINSFVYSTLDDICPLASLELAKGAVNARDVLGIPIAGFDLAGAEAGNPAADHTDAFQYVHEAFLPKTVHAGEDYGPESIFQAITDLHADRIGHGYYLFDTTRIQDPEITNKEKYIRDISQYIANQRITIEVCLTSNMQTNPSIKDIKNHSFRKMMESKISTAFCTDNRTVSKTTVSEEIMLAVNNFPISAKTLRNCIIHGFKRSFFPGDYTVKRKYVRQCLDYYDKIVENVPELSTKKKPTKT